MPVSYIFRLFSGEYTNQPIKPIKPAAFNGNLSVTLNSARKDSGKRQAICRIDNLDGLSCEYQENFPLKPFSSSPNPAGSELDEENYESESEKSIDSWSNNSIESDSNAVLK